MYFNVNFNVCFFKLIKVHLLVSKLYMCQGIVVKFEFAVLLSKVTHMVGFTSPGALQSA